MIGDIQEMIHFNDGVNTTPGLSSVRTSVDHGSICDIASTGRVSAKSMKAAIAMAVAQAGCRGRHPSNTA